MVKKPKPNQLFYTSYSNASKQAVYDELIGVLDNGIVPSLNSFKNIFSEVAKKSTTSFYTSRYFEYGKKNKGIMYKKVDKVLNKKQLNTSIKTSLAVVDSFFKDVEKSILLNKNKIDADMVKNFENRANLIANCEVARISNTANSEVAKAEGLQYWMWGASSSQHTRAEHEVLIGEIVEIGNTPAPDGEYPAELPNCKCNMIFIANDYVIS